MANVLNGVETLPKISIISASSHRPDLCTDQAWTSRLHVGYALRGELEALEDRVQEASHPVDGSYEAPELFFPVVAGSYGGPELFFQVLS